MLLFLNYEQELLDKYIKAEPASVATGSSKLDSSMSGIPERAPHEIFWMISQVIKKTFLLIVNFQKISYISFLIHVMI